MTGYTIDCSLALMSQSISLSNTLSSTTSINGNILIDNVNFLITLTTSDTTLDGNILVFTLTASVLSSWQTQSYNYEITLQQYLCSSVTISTTVIPDIIFYRSYGDGYILANINWP